MHSFIIPFSIPSPLTHTQHHVFYPPSSPRNQNYFCTSLSPHPPTDLHKAVHGRPAIFSGQVRRVSARGDGSGSRSWAGAAEFNSRSVGDGGGGMKSDIKKTSLICKYFCHDRSKSRAGILFMSASRRPASTRLNGFLWQLGIFMASSHSTGFTAETERGLQREGHPQCIADDEVFKHMDKQIMDGFWMDFNLWISVFTLKCISSF